MGKARRPLHAEAEAEAGFSLIELMVALSIFAVIIAAVATGMDAALKLTRSNKQRSTAAYVAGQELESVRSAFSADTTTPASARPAGRRARSTASRSRSPGRCPGPARGPTRTRARSLRPPRAARSSPTSG